MIIPTCNRVTILAACLEKLQPLIQQSFAGVYEIIVTDDGDGTGVEALCQHKFPEVKYTRGPGLGPAANRNHGTSLAKGDWLVFTDDDCLPDAGWLQSYADAIQQYPDCKAFEGAILPDDWNLLKRDMAECPVNDKGGCFWSANIAVEKELFESLNGFDEQFIMAAQEDQDLFHRIKPFTKVTFCKDAVVIHPVRIVSLGKKLLSMKKRSQNYLLYAAKNHQILGFTSKRQTLLHGGILAQLRALFYDLKALRPKSSLVHAYTLFIIYLPMYIKSIFINESYQ